MTSELVECVRFVHAVDHFRLASTEVALSSSPAARSRAPETFVLVPGFAQNRAAFLAGDLPRALVLRGARVFVGELRGHGRSVLVAGGRRAWSLADHLQLDLPALVGSALAATGAKRVHLVGHSMGGMLALAALETSLGPRIASVTTFATPVRFHAHARWMRLLARLAGPMLRLAPSVRMDVFFRAMGPLLIAPGAGGRRSALVRARALLEFVALASERTTDARLLAEILVGADRESAVVLRELAEMAVRGPARIADIELVSVLEQAPVPIASVLSARDVLAPSRVLQGGGPGAGPRMVVEIDDALHVDLAVGRHATELVGRLWRFLVSA